MTTLNNVEKEKTYKVVDARDGGVYNHVTYAAREKADDDLTTRNKRRLEEAGQLLQGWQNRYDPTLHLKVIACDRWGTPLDRKPPAPAKTARTRSRRSS